jgi:hypothetical protein
MTVTRKKIQSNFLKILKTYRKYKDRKLEDEVNDTVGQLPPGKKVKLAYHDDPDFKEN